MCSRILREKIYLVGNFSASLGGNKLPSSREVLKVLFFNLRVVKLDVRRSAKLVIEEVSVFWEKARIPTRAKQHCIIKLEKLYSAWSSLQKNSKRQTPTQREKVKSWDAKLDDLFDVSHTNALNLIKIEEDKLFFLNQRKNGRPGFMYGIDHKSVQREAKIKARYQQISSQRERSICEKAALEEEVQLISSASESESTEGGYPARLKKVLIVTAPLWFKAPFKILRLFVREKLRERVFTVSVPTLSLHVPRKALPIHLGGTLEIEHNSWLLHCRKSMTNREDELLANIGGLSATTATSVGTNQNNLIGSQTANNQQQQHNTQSTAGLVTNGDCQRFLAEPNENIQTNTSALTNGHHTIVPINNTLNNTVAPPANPNNIININNTSPVHSNKLINLTNGVTTPNGDTTVCSLVNGVGGICATTTTATSVAIVGGGGSSQTGLTDFWSENPPSSASSGFSDDDSLAGQEGDPKTIEQIVQMVKTLGRQGLVKEYAEVRSRAPDGTFLHARMRNNLTKNRYTDVLCYDHSRVVLSRVDGDELSDYINANFVDGYKQKNAYISTQGPLPKTSQDFWRMIWEQHCLVVVMTTRVMERGRVKCGQYWEPQENSSLEFGNFHVRTLSIETNEDYTVASLELRNTKTDEVRNVSHWQFTSWPDYGVPSSAMAMITFLQKVREKQIEMVQALGDTWAGHPRGPPIVVHCSAGIGRTGTFITLDICISRLEDVGTADIRGTVERIRSQRAYSIQMPDQYVFCHLALIEYAISRGMLKAVDLTGFDDREEESD